jgi:hypothetical protein
MAKQAASAERDSGGERRNEVVELREEVLRLRDLLIGKDAKSACCAAGSSSTRRSRQTPTPTTSAPTRTRSTGRRVVYDPDTVLYHFESSSRSSEVEDWEKQQLTERWLPISAVDPYSNPSLRRGVPRISAAAPWSAWRGPRLRRRVRQKER